MTQPVLTFGFLALRLIVSILPSLRAFHVVLYFLDLEGFID